jgi:acyl-CoA synthetase (AMP-forming)/AMP-acid ligase II/lauroyl/myristoyl acyltransferase
MKFSFAHALETALAQESYKEALVLVGPDGEQHVTRAEVDAHARYSAHRLLASGIQPGDVIVMLIEHAYEAVPMFVGALYIGAVPMVLPYLTPQSSVLHQRERLSGLVKFFHPKAILTLPRFQADLAALELPVTTLAWDFNNEEALSPPALEISTRGDGDLAYLQFTSGTTGQPKAVMIPHRMLLGAIAGGARRKLSSADIGVGAAPLSHVTGLVGGALGGLLNGIQAIILSPTHWAQQPANLFHAIHKYRATLTNLTNSGIHLCLLRIRPEEIAGVDLSSLRFVSVAAEMISAASLQAFAERFGPYGFRSSVFTTAYSASEAYSFVSELDTHWHADWVSATDLMAKKVATPLTPGSPDARAIVACGTPLPGVSAQIRDEEDQVLPERALGQIVVQTPMVFNGYLNRPDLTASVMKEGWYYTGDMGYLVNNELFVVGRVKDLIIVGGRNVLPDAVEEQVMVATRGLVRAVVAFGVRDETVGTEQPVVICETATPLDETAQREASQAIRERVRQTLDVAVADVRFVESGWIVRAGMKLARTATSEKYLAENRPPTQHEQMTATRTPLEQVTLIFEEILGRKPIGPDENFFDLGGDSISALRLLLRMEKQLGYSVPPLFFKQPTIAHMAKLLDIGAVSEVNQAKEDEKAPPRPTSKRVPSKSPWTTQRVRIALRRRMTAQAFQLSYFEGIESLANWAKNRWVQNLLYPQESLLLRQFCASMGRANSSNAEEVQRSLLSDILNQRLAEFTMSENVHGYLRALKNSPIPFIRQLGHAIAHPKDEVGKRIFEIQGEEYLEASHRNGQGTIILSFHSAARSLSIANLVNHQIPFYWLGNATYRNIFRTLYGSDSEHDFNKHLSIVRAQATQTARQILRAGGIVGITGDTADRHSPIQVVVGDRVRPLRIGFAELAIATGATVIPMYTIQQLDGRLVQTVLPPLDIGANTLSHAARIKHLGHQVGNFLDQVWRQTPGALDWAHMQGHLQWPKLEASVVAELMN